MGLILKFSIAILILAVGGGFLINQVPSWKQKIIEVINPSAKEARLLGELKASLNELTGSLNSPADKSTNSDELISKSKSLVDEIAAINQNNSGIIKQQVGKIINAFLDKTPYPADHLEVKTITSSPLVCPPTK